MVAKKGPACDAGPLKAESYNQPALFRAFASKSQEKSSALRLQYLAGRLHALGERPLFEFLLALERGADMRPTLERYARLSPDFIREVKADRFAKPFIVTDDGGRQ